MPKAIGVCEDSPLSAALLEAWGCITFDDFFRVFPKSQHACCSCGAKDLCYEMPDGQFPEIKYHLCLACFAHVLVAWSALVDADWSLFDRCEESLSERFLRCTSAVEDSSLPN
jgi:hypothetical protein